VRALVFAAAFGAYAWTASPAAGWLDSAELVAAGASLGVPHPPGHPVAALLGRAATLVPLGDASVRVNLASALAVALAAALLHAAAAALLARLAPSLHRAARAVIAAATALGFAWTWSAWFQAVRAEVYGLLAALLVAVLGWTLGAAGDGAADRRPLLAAGLTCGLALATHHFVTLLVLAPAAAVTLARRPGARVAGRVALLGVLGLAALLYLPLRATRDPRVNWGDPDRADRFAWTVSARAFQKAVMSTHGRHDSRAGDAAQVAGVLVEQASPAVALAALAGAYLLARRRPTRAAGLLLLGVAASVAAGPALVGFDPQNPDAHGYLLPALAALFLLAAAAVAVVAERVAAAGPRAAARASLAAAACAALLPPLQAARFARAASLRGGEASDRYARQLVAPLTPRAVLVTSYFESAFLLWELAVVDGERPDVAHLDRSFLTYPGARATARRRWPDLAALVDAPLDPAALAALAAAHREVAYEPHFTLDEGLFARLAPQGPLLHWRAAAEGDEARDRAGVAALDGLLATPAPGDRAGAARLVLWNAYLRARFFCVLGRRADVERELARAARVAPDDPALGDLSATCK